MATHTCRSRHSEQSAAASTHSTLVGEPTPATKERAPKESTQTPALQQKDFGWLPIPRRSQYDPNTPFAFGLALNIWFGFCSTLTVANLYYPQPILIDLAERFGVTKNDGARLLSLTQGGYLAGLILLVPLLDLVPRRPLLLAILFLGATFSIGLATTSSFIGFEIISFLVGIFSVTPQILNPLVADLAPAHRRAQAVAINVTGLVLGMSVGRLLAGIITRFTGDTRNVYWVAAGAQYMALTGMWFVLPNYPKKQTGLSYFQLLKSTGTLVFRYPALLQACLVGWASSTISVGWWTTLTFLLDESPYSYNEFIVSLFALCTLGSVAVTPFVGRMNDRIEPWVGTMIGLLIAFVNICIALGSAKHLGGAIVVTIFTDIAQQTSQISNQARILALDATARSRINSAYFVFAFIGQVTGSSAGSKLFLQHGYRAAYGFSLGMCGFAILSMLARGPHVKVNTWLGWSGDYSLRKPAPKESVEPVEPAPETVEPQNRV